MTGHFTLLPNPRQIEIKDGCFSPSSNPVIQIKTDAPQRTFFSAQQLAKTLQNTWGGSWPITASRSLPEGQKHLTLCLNPEKIAHLQGYRILIRPDQIEILGSDEQGMFYGVQTLRQLIGQSTDRHLPCMHILDWPDFAIRGVMLDISRDKVYKIETLFMLVDELASWKINQLQLYMEHTFAYLGHKTVWHGASPMTPEDILKLDRYCSDRCIELVPNQNSLGHMSRWLKHPTYQHLAETTETLLTPWGHEQKVPFSLSPTQPETLDFVIGLYDQLLPNYSSKQINVGCDETFDLGSGKSKSAVETKGKGQVYLDYLLALHAALNKRGTRMQFWGDIILEYPELIPQLPEDVTALDWGYEGDHPFETTTKKFKESGTPFYVCPGTSSWNSIAGRVSNMLENCKSAAQAGLQNGAMGYLNTDWGDNGHWQQFPISYPGFAAGAAFSWCLESNQDFNLESILNKIVFVDSASKIGQVLVEIGEEYQRWGLRLPNSSPLFWLLQERPEALQRFDFEDTSPIQESFYRLTACLGDLNQTHIQRQDSLMIQDELRLTIKLMIHACQRALLIYNAEEKPDPDDLLYEIRGLIADFQAAWHKRNRIGGLMDSLSRFNVLLDEYQQAHE